MKSYKSIPFVVLAFLIIATVVSCKHSKFPGFKQSESGLYYKFYLQDTEGKKASKDDILTVHMIYRIHDSVIFDSRTLDAPFKFPLQEPSFKGDVFEGLAMMAVGDSATFIINSDSLKRFGTIPNLPESAMLYFDVKMIGIQSKADFDRETELQKQKDALALQKLKDVEQQDILAYVEANHIRVKPTENGLYIIPVRTGGGANTMAGNVVEINYSASQFDGSKLVSTTDGEAGPVYFELGKQFEIPGIEQALMTMRVGGKVKVVVPSDLAYGDNGIQDFVPPCTPVVFDVELLKVIKKEVYVKMMEDKEKTTIEAYLAAQSWNVEPDEYGLYYLETQSGKGAKAAVGSTVSINYSGKLMDGTVFDASAKNNPLTFQLGKGEVIPGLDIGITHMSPGAKATLIIPSKLAYGDKYAGIIPPYTPIVYDIELIQAK